MEIKFQYNIKNFDYILSFDLAKKISGYSLMDLKEKTVVDTGLITTEEDHPWSALYNAFENIYENLYYKYCFSHKNVLIIKERMPSQAGARSTINALQELAKVHAIFDFWCQRHHRDFYDYEGVHSVTVKALFKHLTGLEKPSKQDIADQISILLNNPEIAKMDLNITDSIAIAVTLLMRKWNSDIDKEISLLKKEIKKYKTDKKKNELKERIEFLTKLKKEGKDGENDCL